MKSIIRIGIPTPIPTFSPVESPLGGCRWALRESESVGVCRGGVRGFDTLGVDDRMDEDVVVEEVVDVDTKSESNWVEDGEGSVDGSVVVELAAAAAASMAAKSEGSV